MTALPQASTKVNYDQDSDDILQARAEFAALSDKLNTLISYCAGLFGSDGNKITAMNTLGVGFPSGTVMPFLQPTAPIGWVAMDYAQNLYLATGNNGGATFNAVNTYPLSSGTVLARGHLPAVTLTGVTAWGGVHRHPYAFTWFQVPKPAPVAANMAFGSGNWFWSGIQDTHDGGLHYHDFGVALGGENWPHTHNVDLVNYRPKTMIILVCVKT